MVDVIFRVAQVLMKWEPKSTPVSEHTVKSAVMWLWKLDHMTAVSHTSSAEALLEAMSDEAVSSHIFSEKPQVNPRIFSARLTIVIWPDEYCKDKY